MKAVILDLDDTLWDTTGQHIKESQIIALKEMIKHGLPVKEEDVREFREMLINKYGEHINTTIKALEHFGIFEKDKEKAEKIRLIGHKTYYSVKVGEITPFDDTIPTLKALREKGVRIILLSYGSEYSQNAKIDNLGLREYFDDVMLDTAIGFSDKLIHMKKIVASLEKEGIKKDDIFVVGDSLENEVAAGNELGLKTIRMRHGRRRKLEPENDKQKPDHTITKISEILDIIG